MFSLKSIERKVAKGKKKMAVDISPHPNKKMKIDQNFHFMENENESKHLKKKKNKKNRTDVYHPMKNRRVHLNISKNTKEQLSSDQNGLKNELIQVSDKSTRGGYFNKFPNTIKSIIQGTNADDGSIHEKYTKMDKGDKNITLANNSELSNTSDNVSIKSNTSKNKSTIIIPKNVCLSKRKLYPQRKPLVESSDDISGDEIEELCPWKSFDLSDDEEDNKSNKQQRLNCSGIQQPMQTSPSSLKTNLEQKVVDFNENFDDGCSLVGKFESILKVDECTVLVVLKPGVSFFLNGMVRVTLVSGSAGIFGYALKKEETVTMNSPSLYCLLSLDAVQGEDLTKKKFSYIAKYKLISGNPDFKKMTDAVMLRITKHDSTLPQFLSAAGIKNLFPLDDPSKVWPATIGAIPILPDNIKNIGFLKQTPEWNSCLDTIRKTATNFKDCKVFVCGGKAVGKSTLLKLIVNNLLSKNKAKSVLCLDLDPGQPEMSQPGCITLSSITSPLLGHCFTHSQEGGDGIKILKQVLLGSPSIQNIFQEYINAVKLLLQVYDDISNKGPLIVNTMGWTHNIGLDIMVDLLRLVQPNHVIQLTSTSYSRNFPITLNSELLNESFHGYVTDINSSVLDYVHTSLPSATSTEENYLDSSRAKEKRDLMFLSYFSGLWDQTVTEYNGLTCKATMKMPWNSVGLYFHNRDVARSHFLLNLNASMVALAKVNLTYLETLSDDLFKVLPEDSSAVNPECLGWGIVKGIDPKKKDFHILTPMSKEAFEDVNCLIVCDIALPEAIISMFCDNKDKVPYCQFGMRSGTAKLSSGRKAKRTFNKK